MSKRTTAMGKRAVSNMKAVKGGQEREVLINHPAVSLTELWVFLRAQGLIIDCVTSHYSRVSGHRKRK